MRVTNVNNDVTAGYQVFSGDLSQGDPTARPSIRIFVCLDANFKYCNKILAFGNLTFFINRSEISQKWAAHIDQNK